MKKKILKKKILCCVQFYHPHVGGSEAVVKTIADYLAKRGHEVHVATRLDPGRTNDVVDGVIVHGFNLFGSSYYTRIGTQEEIKKYVDFLHRDWDSIFFYAAQQWSADLILENASTIRAKKIFATCGFSGLYIKEFQPYFNKMPDYLSHIDHVVAHSALNRDFAFFGRNNIPCTIVPNGVDLEEFFPRRSSFREAHDLTNKLLVLFVGSRKRPDLIRAIALELPEVQFVVISHDSAGIDFPGNVRHLLNIPRGDTIDAFFAADAFLLPSDYETFPLVILEAMAAGVPWVSRNCGNVLELPGGIVLHGRQVDLEKEDTKEVGREMAEVLKDVLANPALKTSLGKAGFKAVVDRFNWGKILPKYEALICGNCC